MARPSIKLNRLFTLETRQTVPDGAGGFRSTWVAQGQIWGGLLPATGRADLIDGQMRSVSRPSILVRARPYDAPDRPHADQRLIEGPRIYSIEAVSEYDQEALYLRLSCKEETAR